jgi:dTDP-4-dehydrorhamnose reductase
MKKKILIIGKKSFIGNNLFNYLKKKNINTLSINFRDFLKNYNILVNKYDFIINCSSNTKFVNNKYQVEKDNDLAIALKIVDTNSKLITLSTRKIYKSGFNIKEHDKKAPSCNYSKNKLISERSVKKILKNNSLILRMSNIVGLPSKSKRKLHKTFVDIFFDKAKKGLIYDNNNDSIYKDFISIKKFCEIIFQLMNKNANGIYNVSLGKKVYMTQIINWLNYYNKKKMKMIRLKKGFNNDIFTLNNRKLMNKIKIKNDLNELKIECIKLSKKVFFKK